MTKTPRTSKSLLTDQRQRTRTKGKYAAMPNCPRCHKGAALEAANSVDDGGTVRNDSPWRGDAICLKCIKAES